MIKITIFFLTALLFVSGAYGQKNELINPGCEASADGGVAGWRLFDSGNPYRIDTENVQEGKNSLHVVRRKREKNFGIFQEISYANPSKLPILFGGWSKANGVVGEVDYDIFLDVFYTDGTTTWARKSHWGTGTFDWRRTFSCFRPEKPVAKIKYYVFLREQATGEAWFDNFTLERAEPSVQIGHVAMYPTAPQPADGIFIQAEFFRSDVTYRCRLTDAAGAELYQHEGKGSEIRWLVSGGREKAKTLTIEARCAGAVQTYEYPVDMPLNLPDNPVREGWRIWCADSMTNVSPLTYPPRNASSAISLELAKAESESAQILLTTGPKPVSKVSVLLPDLRSESGRRFEGKVKWERVGYVPRRRPYSYHPYGYRRDEFWLPDPLLPARDFSVPANATQGIWLTVQAARGAEKGTYHGNVILTIDGKTQTVPLTIRVFDFALPETFACPTAFSIMDGMLFRAYPDREPRALRRQAWDIMLDHRLNPDDISRTEMPEIPDLLYARSRGMNRFNLLNLVPKPGKETVWVCFSPPEAYTPALFEEFTRRLDPYVAELRKHGLTKYAYLYGFDERGSDYYPIMKKLHAMLRERYPEIPLMTTSYMYRDLKSNPKRTDCFANDWYCPGTSIYDDELSEKLRAQGHQVWWYTCCNPKHPYPNFASIEYPFIEGRLLGWMTWQHRADGLLFWVVNLWGATPMDLAVCYQGNFKLASIADMPGDGQLLYPGPDGPLPSIRLANIRDGVEDYEYLTFYHGDGKKLCDALAPSMTKFTRDPGKIRQARRTVGEAIEQKKRAR